MRGGRIIFIIILSAVTVAAMAQKVRVAAVDEPLSSVVKRLNVEVSFDNSVLSKYRVTLNRTFSSPQKAIGFLIAGKPLLLKKEAGVYIISVRKDNVVKKHEERAGKVITRSRLDTLSMDLSVSLKEIVITSKSHAPRIEEEDSSSRGVFFNTAAAIRMPGYSDNSVFNVLRMMPGIRASGEPSDELYVWGSSPGESRVTLDGIPLFAMQSYNSNISYINPYMSDEVKYKRGILSASEGSQTGAKVDVTSGMVQLTKPLFKVMASTMSANVFAAVPIGRRSVVSVAYRHTLQGVFGGTTFDAYRNKGDSLNHKAQLSNSTETQGGGSGSSTSQRANSAVSITPEYRFQDFNINFAGEGAQRTYYKFTLYGAEDYMDFDRNDTINGSGDQTSYQGGASAKVGKSWDDGSRSEVSSFFSGLYSTQKGSYVADRGNYNFDMSERVAQFNLKLLQKGLAGMSNFTFGAELNTYRVINSYVAKTAVQTTLFAENKFDIGHLEASTGLRTDIMSDGVKWQPRILLKYHLLKYITLTTSWGIYDQYLVKDPFLIFENSYQFRWDINRSLKSYNSVAGIAFNRGGLNVSAEAYLKKIRSSVWVVGNQLGYYDFDLKGLDVSAKYNWRHGLLFASWSLSDDSRQTDGVAHEIKAGGLFRFYPFSLSANYVFGKGYNTMLLPTSSYGEHNGLSNSSTTYSRMDIYASYEKRFKYVGLTVGASLINVFNTDNVKYSTSWIPRGYASSSFYSKASSRTPVIFVELKF